MQEADYTVWRKYLETAGDRAMVARLDAIFAAQRAECKTTITLPDGTETQAPLMILAEANVAAQQGESETEWRQEWTRRLVRLAVKWQDDLTTQGVVSVLTVTEGVIADMRAAGVWPWGNE